VGAPNREEPYTCLAKTGRSLANVAVNHGSRDAAKRAFLIPRARRVQGAGTLASGKSGMRIAQVASLAESVRRNSRNSWPSMGSTPRMRALAAHLRRGGLGKHLRGADGATRRRSRASRDGVHGPALTFDLPSPRQDVAAMEFGRSCVQDTAWPSLSRTAPATSTTKRYPAPPPHPLGM
jgi:hypothetical protein